MRPLLTGLIALFLATDAFAGAGRIIIVNNDGPGVGFNDPKPVAPIGGNEGTTLGQQRLNVFNAAAEKWSSLLETDVNIIAQATFAPIAAGCDATSAVLGQAAPFSWKESFEGAPQANVWYPIALANKFAGRDLEPAMPDIFVQFNADIDNSVCLGDTGWYYGLDRNPGNNSDLFVVVLHELGHGLGISGATGAPGFRFNKPAIFDTFTFDTKAGQRWTQMSEAQRRVSLTNTGSLVWDGPNVRNFATLYLRPMTALTITEPQLIARNYDIGSAAFGANLEKSALSGRIVQATDAANSEGPTTTDGCTAFTNAAAIDGNVAFVDRGVCTFVTKARNAQAAGATALVVADNARTTCAPPGMAGTADDVTIPVLSISANDGDILRQQLSSSSVRGTLRVDPSQLSGASGEGYVRLYAPCTVSQGSSTHHWDVAASPNLLMEPNINPDLQHGVDLTIFQLMDMGWTQPAKSGRRFLKR